MTFSFDYHYCYDVAADLENEDNVGDVQTSQDQVKSSDFLHRVVAGQGPSVQCKSDQETDDQLTRFLSPCWVVTRVPRYSEIS